MLLQLLMTASLASGPDTSSPTEFLATELRASRLEDSLADDEIAKRIAGLGLDAFEDIFDILEQRRVPPIADESPQILSVPQTEILLDALAQLDQSAIRDMVVSKATASTSPERRTAVLHVLSRVGNEEDVSRLLKLAEQAEGKSGRPIKSAFERGLVGVLRNSDESFRKLKKYIPELPDGLQIHVVFALGKARRSEGAELLLGIFDRYPDLRVAALTQAGTLGLSQVAQVNEGFSTRAQEWLVDGSPSESRAAAIYLAEVREEAAIPGLIQMLTSESEGVRDNALYALRKLANLPLPENPTLWTTWHTQELAWFTINERRIEERLSSANDAIVAAAIQDIGRRRLRRDTLAAFLVPTLDHDKVHLRVLACQMLAALSSPTSVSHLVQLLRDENETVVNAAHQALKTITGLDLSSDYESWSAEYPSS